MFFCGPDIGSRPMNDDMQIAGDALDFCESLSHLQNPSTIADSFQKIASNFGFDHFIITDIPFAAQPFERAVLMRRWPTGWFEVYAQRGFVRADPVIKLCRSTTSLFEWSEALYDPEIEPRAHEVMMRAKDFGLMRGLSLPIHGLDGLETCFSISGKQPDLTGRTRPALHLMMMYAYERIRQIVRHEHAGTNPLTPREREVLCWAANGKSASETADLMAITERTVNAHAGSAIAKLGANSRTQAVVRAMQNRFIHV